MKNIVLSFSVFIASTGFAMLTTHEQRLARFQESAKQLSILHGRAYEFYKEMLERKENKDLPDKSIKSTIEAEISNLKSQELKVINEAACRAYREKNGTPVQTSKGTVRQWQELLAHQIAIQDRSIGAREAHAVCIIQELQQKIENAEHRDEAASGHAIQ